MEGSVTAGCVMKGQYKGITSPTSCALARLPKQVPKDTFDNEEEDEDEEEEEEWCMVVMVVAAERISVTLRHTRASCTGSSPASPVDRVGYGVC